jgi:hypothetical protein
MYYLYPRWSRDGRWIAFQRGDSIRFDVVVAPATAGEPRQLTHHNSMMSGLAWLADSTGIVYSSSRGGTMPYLPTLDLWEVRSRDGNVRQLTCGEPSSVSPDVANYGALVVARMKVETDIWKFPADGAPAGTCAERCVSPDTPGRCSRPPRARATAKSASYLWRRPRQPVGREHRECGPAAADVVLKKVPVDGGPAVTVTTERLRNVIGSDGTTLYYSPERPLMDGTPEFEIRAATPEDAPFRVLARIPASRVPLWQIVNPALPPHGKWLAVRV